MLRRCSFVVLLLAVISLPALAHPGHGSTLSSFGAGFAHPLLGLDHVLAMVAVGVWARVLGGRAVWIVPIAFVICMVGGFAIALAGISLPAVELGIAASVILLGALIATAGRLPLAFSMSLVGLFAVFHGYAHGTEVTVSAPTFGLGFVAATILLHGAGIGLGRLLVGHRHLVLKRGVGGAVAGIGLVLLGGWI